MLPGLTVFFSLCLLALSLAILSLTISLSESRYWLTMITRMRLHRELGNVGGSQQRAFPSHTSTGQLTPPGLSHPLHMSVELDSRGSASHGVWGGSSHLEDSSCGHRRCTKSQNNLTSPFQDSACAPVANISSAKASHRAEPKLKGRPPTMRRVTWPTPTLLLWRMLLSPKWEGGALVHVYGLSAQWGQENQSVSVWSRKRFTTGPCQETGAHALKNPELSEGLWQSIFKCQVREAGSQCM